MIEVKVMTREVGDIVFVPATGDGRIKPRRVRIGKIRINIDTNGSFVEYLSETGAILPDVMYDNPWTCEKAIDILEKHRREGEQELHDLAEKDKQEETK